MKDTEAAAVGRAPEPARAGATQEPAGSVRAGAAPARAEEPESFTNRKLIRPTLPREHRGEGARPEGERRERTLTRKAPPPDVTHAENFYYQKQMQSKTPMVLVLHDGEQVHGTIEWYDKASIKVNRSNGQSNLLIYKGCIKYMFKESEGNGRR